MIDYLETSSAEVAGCVVLTAVGEIDIESVVLLDAALVRHAGSGAPLILDLSGVTFFDSSGLHLIVRARRDATGGRRRLAVVPSARVRSVLDLVEASRGLEIHPTLAAALTAVRSATESARLWHTICEHFTQSPYRPVSPQDS